MRKKALKLALHKETVRELSGKQLSRAIGGLENDGGLAQTRDKQCTAAAAGGG